jgi:hypothetical protein
MNEGSGASRGAVAMFGGLMFVATLAIVLSQRATTVSILDALGNAKTGAIPGVLGAALSPITGSNAENYGNPASPAGAR